MKKKIKSGKNIGIAIPVQGQIVEVEKHPRFQNMWKFSYQNETWVCSAYAFEEE